MVLSYLFRGLFQRKNFLRVSFGTGLSEQQKNQSNFKQQSKSPAQKLSITFTCKVCNSKQVSFYFKKFNNLLKIIGS